MRLRQNRPDWITIAGGGRLSIVAHDRWYWKQFEKLRQAMIASHPDKGGTSAKFISAQVALKTFVSTERQWYQLYGVPLPKKQSKAEKEKVA